MANQSPYSFNRFISAPSSSIPSSFFPAYPAGSTTPDRSAAEHPASNRPDDSPFSRSNLQYQPPQSQSLPQPQSQQPSTQPTQQQPQQANYIPSFFASRSQGRPSASFTSDFSSPKHEITSPFPGPGASPSGASPQSTFGHSGLFKDKKQFSTTPTAPPEDAPPTESLFDMMDGAEDKSPFKTTPVREPWASFQESTASEPMDTDRVEATRVMVFGFPPNMTSNVISWFRSCGDIANYEVGPGESNWVVINFADVWGASKALSKNGKSIGGGIIVGVVPAEEERKEESAPRAGASLAEPSPFTASPTPGARRADLGGMRMGVGSASAGTPHRITVNTTTDVFKKEQPMGRAFDPAASVLASASKLPAENANNANGKSQPGIWSTIDAIFGW
ncbi:uncharacterized protein VTP21DRAFT_2486 [Calcarisporiella thermophila]|uniref:uncharacterized protein n=1 Tax=Calcarisporiella thermophila TaxID=911321 RepID=UPI003742AC7E